jgi:hypothetical protein
MGFGRADSAAQATPKHTPGCNLAYSAPGGAVAAATMTLAVTVSFTGFGMLARCATAGAGNDYQKDLQFRKLNAQKDIIEVTVTRGGQTLVRASVRAA